MNRRSFFAALALLPTAVKVMLSGPRISAAELKAPVRWFDASDKMPYTFSARDFDAVLEKMWNDASQPSLQIISQRQYDRIMGKR